MPTAADPPPRLVKKYSNRKLYDTSSRRYITLERIGELVRAGESVQVVDRTSGEDLTAVTLSQVVLDNERKRHGAVPEALLQQLVRAPGEVFKEAVRQSISAGQNLIQQAEERVVQQPEAAIEEARRTLQRLKIPGQGEIERLEHRIRELTDRVQALAAALESLHPGITTGGTGTARRRASAPARKPAPKRAASATKRKGTGARRPAVRRGAA